MPPLHINSVILAFVFCLSAVSGALAQGLNTGDPDQSLPIGAGGNVVITVTPQGNVGIGTTNPSSVLQIIAPTNKTLAQIGSGDFSSFQQRFYVSSNATFDSSDWPYPSAWVAHANAASIMGIDGDDGSTRIWADTSLENGEYFAPSLRMIVDSTGVGIGLGGAAEGAGTTGHPLYPLQVGAPTDETLAQFGGSGYLSSFQQRLFLSSNATLNASNWPYLGAWLAHGESASMMAANGDDGSLRFWANTGLTNGEYFSPSLRMIIDSTGVGIGLGGADVGDGTAGHPQATLDVGGSVKVGSAQKPSGITLYDETNGAPYCVNMRGGKLAENFGACP